MRRLLAAGGAIIIVAGALAAGPHFGAAQSAASWTTFHGDQTRDGISSVSGTTSKVAASEFTLPSAVLGIPSSPVVDAAGVAYIGGSDGKVYALDPVYALTKVNGQYDQPKWTFKTGGAVNSTPSLSPDGATLYVGSDDGFVYALTTANGAKKWQSANLGSAVTASPLVSRDGTTIYIPASDGTLYALNTADGSLRWKFTPGGSMPTSAAASPDGGTIYIVAGAQMYGVPAGGVSSGQGAPTFYLSANGTSTPAVDSNGFIYVGTDQGTMVSFASTSPTPRFTFIVPGGGPVASSPAFVNGLAVFGALGGIFAINQQSGQQTWHAPAASAVAVNSSPAVANGNSMIYVGSTDGNLYGLNASGTVIFQRSAGAAVDASPAIGPEGSVWTASRSGVVDRLLVIAPPATIALPTATTTPVATNTPTVTPTPIATSTPTPTATPSAVPLSLSLKSKVKDGQKQIVKITSAPNTVVHIRVDYPNGDHQSAKRTTGAGGTVTYAYKQGASKMRHNRFTATVTLRAGTGSAANTATKRYQIAFGVIDVSAEPRKLKVGKVVDIFVHTYRYVRVVVFILAPNAHAITRQGRTGPKGLASIKFKVTSGLTRGRNHKVVVLAKLKGGNPRISTKTTFTIS